VFYAEKHPFPLTAPGARKPDYRPGQRFLHPVLCDVIAHLFVLIFGEQIEDFIRGGYYFGEKTP